MPETITAVLDLRLSRLSPACRRILSKAAVLGGFFEFPIICSMETNTPSSNEDVVLELIEEALYAGMLTEEGIGTRITYQFWHPLLVSHLYESLSAARRASLHRRAAEILLKIYATREEEGAAIISYHLVHGGADSDQITHYSELAGNRAYALSAYPDAEKHYRFTLEHMSTHPDEQLHRAEILELLGECVRIQGKYEETRQFYGQILEIGSKKQIYVAKEEQQQEIQQEAQIDSLIWCEIGLTWYDTVDNIQARQCYDHAEHVLREANVIAGPAWARLRYLQSYIHWREGNYEDASRIAYEALKLYKQAFEQKRDYNATFSHSTRVRRTLIGDPVDLGRTQMLLGLIANGAGRSDDALDHFNAALTLYEQNSCQRDIAIVCCNLGDLYLRKTNYSQAQSALRRSLNLAERIGELPLISYALDNLGILDIRIGNLVDAEVEIRRGVMLAERVDDLESISLLYIDLAAVLLEQGKPSDARITLYRALAISRVIHNTTCIGIVLVVLGSMRITQSIQADTDEERTYFLKRARKTLKHALMLEGMEVETRTEGQLALAHVSLLLSEMETAHQYALQALEEARQSELTWLVARAQRIFGCILVAKEEHEQAVKQFEQALRTFRKCGMRLECGRTLQQYGCLLMQQGSANDKPYERGLTSLQEARQLFIECQAQLDLQSIERILNEHQGIKSI